MGSEQERRRVAALREYHLLDTPPAAELEAVIRVAATVAGVPYATLNLLDDQKQYQLTTVGFAGRPCDREDSMCAVRLDHGVFVHLPDAREDPDYRDNPWVTGELGSIVFYASAPLISPGGLVMGTLCVFDGQPRRLSQDQIDRLRDLAGIVVAFFERRRLARLSAGLRETIQGRDQWTRTVLDNIDAAVIAINTSGRATLVNRAAHGLHPDTDMDAGPDRAAARYQLYEPDGRRLIPDDQVPLAVAMRDGTSVKGREIMIRMPGREPRSVLANAAPLRTADGIVSGAVVALHDITAEHARRRILEEAHERLAAANADLRRSNIDLTHFAGAVSHDLVAPLASVGGYLELLDDPDEPQPRITEWVTSAARAVARMRDLIDSLLDYGRAGSAPVRALAVPLKDLIDEVLHDLAPEIAAAGARVSVPGPLPEVIGDPVLIRQLLQNLIGNAVKYRDPGRPARVEITADGPAVRIADNGIGIPASRREEVFDMFARADGQAARGHGIGLSSCLRIVERHGGTITIGDTPGGGTTVTVTLPGKQSDHG
ncbi:sensor histidine kinase [Actinoplanes subglobosus]|uniref:Sensor-like histidine kinase SenX3 n=1 Tax=Actinoplanes subglobosus TaxID=1547892 RepID=A0ABV8IYP7_9ACTN